MKLRGFVFRFQNIGGIVFPTDKELHSLAVKFADQYLNAPANLADYESVTVVCELDDSGKPVKVVGMNARVARWDYPIWRFLSEDAGTTLIERTRASLDEQGGRGGEVFVHVSEVEKPESRCPRWKEFLKLVGAENASRWRVKV